MKLCVAILHVIAFLALTGSTLGDDEATSPRVCTVEVEEHSNTFGTLVHTALNCVATDGTGIEELKETKSLDERKTFFKKICDKRQRIRECLSVVEEQSEICQDQTHHVIFKIFRELLETTLDSGCIQDGEVLASALTIYDNSSSVGPFTSDPFHGCVATGIEAAKMSANIDLQLETLFFILYRDAIHVKECFGRITHEEDINVARKIKSILNDIIEKMKCIHPRDGTAVLCTTVDVTLPDTPRLCPIKSYQKESSVFDLLIERFGSCLQSDLYLGHEQIGDVETLDKSLSLLKHYCVRRKMNGGCLSDVVAFSSTCLEETEHKVIKVLEDLLQYALEYSCIADGEYLGYVLYKVMSYMKATPNQKIVKECLAVAGQLHPDIGTQIDAARVLTYHRQLKVFKGCFINKLRGDNRAVFNAEHFLTLVQKSMKCIEPEHGTIVLCETIDSTPSTGGTKVCPFVGDREDEPPKREMFFDFGINCLKASTKDFRRLDDFSTLEEFRTFFASFCHEGLAMNHCVDYVSSNSALCLNQTNHQVITIFTDFLHSLLETGCEHDGEALATIMHGLISGGEGGVDSDQAMVCMDTAGKQINTARLSGVSTSVKSMTLYRTFESLKDCILNADYEVGFKNVFAKFVNDVRRSFKCVHPDDGTLVLCETIVNN